MFSPFLSTVVLANVNLLFYQSLCTDAAMGPIRQLGPKAMEIAIDQVPPISYKHFKKSLRGTRPSVAPGDLNQYVEWDKTYGTKRYDEDEDE